MNSFYYLWRERRLPTNVDPLKSKINDPMERARLARIFEQGLDKVVGFAIPLTRKEKESERTWRSGPWFLRSETMYLLPGDSPMGYRLPLDSQPWVSAEDYPYYAPIDPMDARGPLPAYPDLQSRTGQGNEASKHLTATRPFGQGFREQAPKVGVSDPSVVRTSLCVEVRGGLMYVFMPPLEDLEDYLELIAAIESVAAERGRSVMIEGYPPPFDYRLRKFSVTPDPGVIEVNIHPTGSWDELTELTTTLYDDARSTRLITEKFMVDGRHVGTGGGNHIVIGGSTPADSPLLRRPDLLKSLLGFWHNHPSLSYLFSGMFIGPTSQHPRIDEARDDSTYELETAFKALGQAAVTEEGAQPWLVDRIFRDILVDVTGNTHRTEFCVDKLYSPDSSTGRLGLLELRAFEMPPHARMSLAQQLLLRALVSAFWRKPYDQPLARYGTRLHDEFMLPFFCATDFADVLGDLRRAGYAFNPAWFTAHQEFRFPQIGQVAYRGIEIELRQALEPWHVLGEDAAPGGTARNVDSSVERLQVKLNGMVDARHILVCNGQAVPLRATGTDGEYVAGVRYRAWQPPRALHPTLPVDAPLVFDLYDRWSSRSVGGCAYHVSHPGGRNYERFPVNANAAETRRRSRFFAFGHTDGAFTPAPTAPTPERPLTLDLRRHA